MSTCHMCRIVAAIAIVAPVSLSFASGGLTTVSSTGPAPGVEGADLVGYTTPTIDQDGVIGIVATAVGPGAGEFGVAEGLWFSGEDGLEPAISPGIAAPGVEGASISGIQWYARTDEGLTVFVRLRGESLEFANDRILWKIGEGGYTKLLRNGDPVFGFEGAVYQTISPPLIGEDGAHVSRVFMSGPGINSLNGSLVLNLSDDGEHRVLLQSGGEAPGVPGTTMTTLSVYNTLDALGNLPIGAFFFGPGIDNSNSQAIWMLDAESGGTELLVRRGDVAPGGFGSPFADLGGVVSNHSGETMFQATLGLSRGLSGQAGIWVRSPFFTRAVVLTGTPAPGAGGALFDFLISPVIGSRGNVAFVGFLEGEFPSEGQRRGVWTETRRGLRLVVRGGDPVPGLDGVTFDVVSNFAINRSGLVVFSASVQGEGIGSSNRFGLYAWMPSGEIIELARRGERVVIDGELSASAVADIRFHDGTGGADGRPSSLNDAAELVFSMRFDDGSSRVVRTQLSNARGPDLDESGRVDMQDLNEVLMNFGFGDGGDTNDDGVTDLQDLNAVLGSILNLQSPTL